MGRISLLSLYWIDKMKNKDILTSKYELLTDHKTLDIEFKGIYTTDLLSSAIKNMCEQDVLITIISHDTTVALAMMIDLSSIIIAENKSVSQKMIEKANEHHIALFKTHLKSYEVVLDFKERGLI